MNLPSLLSKTFNNELRHLTSFLMSDKMIEIKSLSQFHSLQKSSSLLIIDFHATWCGPCKVISPVFERLSKPHDTPSTSIIFAKCDVDKAQPVAQECGITAMPTFQFFKGGKKVDEVRGADPPQLTTKIQYYTTEAAKEVPKASAAGASSSGSGNKDSKSGSLRSLIDVEKSRLLGTSMLSNIRNVLSPPPTGYAIASATNSSKLLLYLVFKETVDISQLKLTIVKDGKNNAPARIQLGADALVQFTKDKDGVEANDLSMVSVSKTEKSQAINVFSDEYSHGVAELKLKASKFSGVKSLMIRVDANLSGEDGTVTKIGEMDLIGKRA